MLGIFEQYIPKFQRLSKTKQMDVILYGIERDKDEQFNTNVSLQFAAQKFIYQSKRFNR